MRWKAWGATRLNKISLEELYEAFVGSPEYTGIVSTLFEMLWRTAWSEGNPQDAVSIGEEPQPRGIA